MSERPGTDRAQATAADRRVAEGRGKRHACIGLHMVVAPFVDRRPAEGEFRQARSYSISTTDIAFYWPTSPDFERVVIGLGGPPASILVVGQVVFHGPDPDSKEHLVRCTILQKLPLA